MGSKKILTIKGWVAPGKGNVNLELVDYTIETLQYRNGIFVRLTVRRKPDQYSSRLGMMAYLNNRHGKLSWGFAGMTLKVDEFSKKGALVTKKEYDYKGVAVESSSADGKLEVVALVATSLGSSCDGDCSDF